MNTFSTRTKEQASRSLLARHALAVAAMVALGSLAVPAAAAVYKWVDPQGRIHYSDLPPPPEGKLLAIDTTLQHAHTDRTEAPPRPAAQLPAAASSPSAPAAGPAASPEAAARLKQAVDSDVSNARADQCKQAKDKYETYVRSRRLYKEGPNKERIYLSDQELDTERLQAKHDVDEFCGTGR